MKVWMWQMNQGKGAEGVASNEIQARTRVQEAILAYQGPSDDKAPWEGWAWHHYGDSQYFGMGEPAMEGWIREVEVDAFDREAIAKMGEECRDTVLAGPPVRVS